MKTAILSALLLGAFSAYAGEATDDQARALSFQGERTRAEVRAEYLSAKRGGTLMDTSEAASHGTPRASALPRGAKKAEAVDAARAHPNYEQM
jgi:hypothetical protein